MRAVLADAGPLYAASDASDAHHSQAQEQLQKLQRERRQIAIAYPTLLEAHALILVRLGTSAAFRWLGYMSDAALVNPGPEDYRQGFSIIRSFEDQSITLFDATLAALATRTGLHVWTYDHHFDVMRIPVWR